jgi:N-acylneuraminate cytidylyltransferase
MEEKASATGMAGQDSERGVRRGRADLRSFPARMNGPNPTAVALVPARAGSERVPGKNVRPLAGHPLIAYSIAGARESGRFRSILVSTDSPEIARIAEHYGAEVPGLRPAEMAGATSPDIDWVRHVLSGLEAEGRSYEVFSILRPTSPFRTGETIARAFDRLVELGDGADSIRAVEKCRQHPGKMWVIDGELMHPLLAQPAEPPPLHSRQYKSLPPVYVQNSSLEVAWTRAVTEQGSISGERVAPFLTDEAEGFSVDYEDDWDLADRLLASGRARLPDVREAPVEAATR